jgi:radical SAM superfamily enzyme YgiQ (UPF0313 family)
MLRYDEPLFRPPSESESLIFQITLGCSYNRCTFCSMYRSKRFSAKSLEAVRADIGQAVDVVGHEVRRVFLADGNALCLSSERLVGVLDALGEAFPRLLRVGIYANAQDVLSKSADELAMLRQKKLKLVYFGLESGDDETLLAVNKGSTAAQMVEAVRRVQAAGIQASVMVLVGLAGRHRRRVHAERSAEALNRMAPAYTALLTYTPTPGSPLAEAVARGELELPDPMESLEEIRTVVAKLECATYFACNHASNYLPLTGRLPSAKARILAELDAALAGHVRLKPEFLRGL